jgi:putative Holliday junction resolvase
MPRTLGIDFGAKRVGLALSDEGGRFATPHDVLAVSSPQQAIDLIAALVEREGVERLVVGLPLNMDNTIGPAARGAANWGNELARRTGRPLVLVDERLSSYSAEQQLIQRKRGGEHLTRRKKKDRLDALAAASFLQAFLDGQLEPILL